MGLYELANQIGFNAEGYKGSINELEKIDAPVILHVTILGKLYHFVVCFGFETDCFIIHDPAGGIIKMNAKDLEEIWVSKTLLFLQPKEDFPKKKTFIANKIKWVKSIIQDDVNIFVAALFLGIVLSVLGFSTAIYSQQLIDKILPSQNPQTLVISLFLLGLLIFFRILIGYVRGYLLTRQNREFNVRIIKNFLSKLLSLPITFFENRKTGDLIARLNDSLRIQGTISYLASSVTIDLLSLVVSIIIIFIYSKIIGFVTLICIPIFIFMVMFFNRSIMKKQKDVMSAHSINESQYIDTIQGIHEVQMNNRENIFLKITTNAFNLFQNKSFDLGKFSLRYGLITGIIGLIFSMTIISLSTFMVLKDQLQLGEMVVLLSVANGVIPLISGLTSINIVIQEAKIAFNRMYDMMYYEKNDEHPQLNVSFDTLDIKELNFRYPGCLKLLNNINININKGEIVALLGESGCGKSTLIKIINKFYKPSGGGIYINSINTQEIDTSNLRSIISVVPQNIKLFNASLLANICLEDHIDEAEKIIDFCKIYGFDKYFERFPSGYLTILGESGIKISGGQAQLIGLARAIYRQPQLLLLDEATSAMDKNTEAYIINLLQKIKSEISVFLITHRITTAAKADRIYLLENGEISASGNHQELLSANNFYSQYFKDISELILFA